MNRTLGYFWHIYEYREHLKIGRFSTILHELNQFNQFNGLIDQKLLSPMNGNEEKFNS